MHRAATALVLGAVLAAGGVAGWALAGPLGSLTATPAMLVAAARFRTGEEARTAQPWRNGHGLALPTGVVVRVPPLPEIARSSGPRRAPRHRVARLTWGAVAVALLAFVVLVTGTSSPCESEVFFFPAPECSWVPEAHSAPATWLGVQGWGGVLLAAVATLAWSLRRRA